MTLKGVPDELYERLRASAAANRRSLNNEAIVCLEIQLQPKKLSANEHLARAREIRETLPKGVFKPEEIDRYKRSGRS